MKLSNTLCGLSALLILAALPTTAATTATKKNEVWKDPVTALKKAPCFAFQGEYGSTKAGAPVGVQVLSLGGGNYDAYILQDGLPGLGWTREKTRTALKGSTDGEKITFFSADKKISATISGGQFLLTRAGEKGVTLPRVERTSPTLGAKPPKGAVILFDGSSADQWKKGKVENGLLLATGCTSKQLFRDYTAHLEFRTPYKPHARGQGRGNSGIYWGGRWETQILDSFGLEGKDNQCGGIYSISKPILNMCLPPLVWQTYDIDFTAATFDTAGKRTAWPRITVKLNGVVVHDNLELAKDLTTSAPLKGPLKTPAGPIHLQNHGNPIVFRNIWVVPGK